MLPETVDNHSLVLVMFGLFFFGCFYAALIAMLRKYLRRWTAFLVVVGVGVTLIGVALLDARWALLMLMAFGASGAPMIIGDVVRVEQEELAVRKALKGKDDDAA